MTHALDLRLVLLEELGIAVSRHAGSVESEPPVTLWQLA
jgi:hypothetical protein